LGDESIGRIGVAVPAAGSGGRMGGRKKAFLELGGMPLLRRSLDPFLELSGVVAVVVALPPEEAADPPEWMVDLDPRLAVVPGGATRRQSVRLALEALPADVEVAVIHDGARPLVTREIIERCVEVAVSGMGAVAGWPLVDTLKRVGDQGFVEATPDREGLWRAQTPQAFPLVPLLEAYRRAEEDGMEATDDAAVFVFGGGRVRMVEGSPWNLKVTHPEDLRAAELLLGLRKEVPT